MGDEKQLEDKSFTDETNKVEVETGDRQGDDELVSWITPEELEIYSKKLREMSWREVTAEELGEPPHE